MNSPIRSSVFLGDTAHQSLPLVFLPRLPDDTESEKDDENLLLRFDFIFELVPTFAVWRLNDGPPMSSIFNFSSAFVG